MLRAQVMPLWPKPFNQALQGLLKAVPTLVGDPCQFHGSCFSSLVCMLVIQRHGYKEHHPPSTGIVAPSSEPCRQWQRVSVSTHSQQLRKYCCFPLKEMGSATLQSAWYFGTRSSTIGKKSAQAQSRAILVVIDPTHPKGSSITFRGPLQGSASTSNPPTR